MKLQDVLMNRLIDDITLGQKITNADNVATKHTYALDAIEKNPALAGTLAYQIKDLGQQIDVERANINRLSSLQ